MTKVDLNRCNKPPLYSAKRDRKQKPNAKIQAAAAAKRERRRQRRVAEGRTEQ